MPIYDFKCPRCGNILKDILVDTNNPTTYICHNHYPHTINVEMERQFPTGQTFRLKGDGFYKPSKD